MSNVHAYIGERGGNLALQTRYVVVTGDADSTVAMILYPASDSC